MKIQKALLAVLPILLGLFSMTPKVEAATATGTVCSKVVTYKLIDKIRTTVVNGKQVRELVTRREVVRVHGRKVVKYVPVKVRDKVTSTVCAKPAAYLDPTFVQSPTNPLSVTWCASVNDTNGKTSPCQYDNGTTAPTTVTRDPSLPNGVLDFYIGPVGSTAGLVCSTNVGPTVNYADCAVKLTQTGTYSVITEYLSGRIDSSASEQATISPYSTTTTASIAQNASACSGGLGTIDTGATPTSYCNAWTVTASSVDQSGNALNTGASLFWSLNGSTPVGGYFSNPVTFVETAVPVTTPANSWRMTLSVLGGSAPLTTATYTGEPDTWSPFTITAKYLGTAGYSVSSQTVTGAVAA